MGEAERIEDRHLDKSVFLNCAMAGVTFDDVNMADAVFHNVNLSGALFDDINLSDVRISNVNIKGLTIYGYDIYELLQPLLERDGKPA